MPSACAIARRSCPKFVRSSKERGADEWIALLTENAIPAGPIRTVGEALNDPHVAARNFIVETDHPLLGNIKSLATPIHFSDTETSYRSHPPQLGEQTDEVLKELGYSADTIEELRKTGIV